MKPLAADVAVDEVAGASDGRRVESLWSSLYAAAMRIVFGADLDDGGYPGPLAGRAAAVLDESWVGVQGLVALLEIRLGLLRLDPPGQSERAAHLAKRLRMLATTTTTTWPWAQSLEVDPLSTARVVLRLKDALVLAGVDASVDANTLPPRLAAVHAAVVDIAPGIPERALAVIAALQAGEDPRLASLETLDDVAMFPGLVRRLLDALRAAGTAITAWSPPLPPDDRDDDSDLARIRRGDTSGDVTGDGSLILLRTDTIDEAAAEIAALIASTDNVLVIGGDIVLDEALHRRGAPTLGLRGDVGTDALLALLPLVVALDDHTPDPERLFELLSLPLSPVPRDVAWRVRRALIDTPSATADDVLVAVTAGLDRLYARVAADEGTDSADSKRSDAAARLAALIPAWGPVLGVETSAASGADIDVVRLRARLITLQRHLFGRQKDKYGDDERTPFQAALRQIGLCLRLLAALDVPTLSPPQLARLLDSATSGVRPRPTWPAEVGVSRVQRPGAVCGPVDVVVWWNFTRESGRLPPRTLTAWEHRALHDAGFDPGAIDVVAGRFADAQRRPLLHARQRLILCAPRRGANGREHHPHPLWDELMAVIPAVERKGAIKNLRRPDEDDRPGRRGVAARIVVDSAVLPGPRRLHRFPPGSVLPRDVTSPSREERLLGCGFQFVLHERGATARELRLKRGAALEGDVVHAVLGEVLRRKRLNEIDSPAASLLARTIYDELVPKMAGAWTRPGREQVRLRVRERVARAAAALVALLDNNGLEIVSVETEFEKEWSVPALAEAPPSSRVLKGTPDLVVDGDDVDGKPIRLIIDHKTGNDDYRRAALRTGVPVQLLDYALLVADRSRPARLGYFQLRSGRLLTTMQGLLGAEHVVAERTPQQGWALLEQARHAAFSSLHTGEVEAPGAQGGNPGLAIVVDSTGMHLQPPCAYCRADALCGRASSQWTLRKSEVPRG